MNKKFGWIRPFQLPNIGIVEVDLSEEQFNYVKQCIENKGESIKETLVGNIDNSYRLEDKDDWFFNNVCRDAMICYKDHFVNLGQSVPTTKSHEYVLDAWWVNYQKKHEFNPIHDHTGVYSFVIWVKIPTEYRHQHSLGIAKGVNPFGGVVTGDFAFNYTNIIGKQSSFIYNMGEYVEGRMILFPSDLRHCVYPFYDCDEERVSISGNICLDT